MERELTKEIQRLREENKKLWELVESLKNTNTKLIQTYLVNTCEKDFF